PAWHTERLKRAHRGVLPADGRQVGSARPTTGTVGSAWSRCDASSRSSYGLVRWLLPAPSQSVSGIGERPRLPNLALPRRGRIVGEAEVRVGAPSTTAREAVSPQAIAERPAAFVTQWSPS